MKIDSNNEARLRAGKRSSNRNAGKDPEEGLTEEGGIVAEAQAEVDAVDATPTETPDAEPAAAAEEATETPEEEVSEPAAEEATETPEEEVSEPAAAPTSSVGDYQAPEGESHDALIDKYHEALAFGDTETAKEVYKQLQEHRFQENTHRAKASAQSEKDVQDYLKVAMEISAVHPELAQDGLEANKVLALSDLYRNEGLSAAEALVKAVGDLYPEAAPEQTATKEVPEEQPVIPDMAERQANKQGIQSVPSASAKNEPEPAPEAPNRSSAIEAMKAARNQK